MAPPSHEIFGAAQTPEGVHGVPRQSASDLQIRLHCMAASSGPKPTGQGLMQVAPLQDTPGSPDAVLQGFCAPFMMQSTAGRGHPARGAPTTTASGADDGVALTSALGGAGLDDAIGPEDAADGAAERGFGSAAVLSSSLATFLEEQPIDNPPKPQPTTITTARSIAQT